MIDKDLQIAAYLEEIPDDTLPFPVFYASHPIIGRMSEDSRTFTEYLTGQIFLNSDIAFGANVTEGFNFVTNINDLQKEHPDKTLDEIYKDNWEQLEKLVYFYDEETGKMIIMTIEKFEESFDLRLNINFTEDINEINNAILDGDVEKIKQYLEENIEVDSTPYKRELDKPISEVIEEIKKKIISQDDPVKRLAVAIYKNYFFDNPAMKSNILLYGPTGVGKTALIRTLADVFDYPVWIEDMTRYTETGYKGANTDDILVSLYYNADRDLDKAERTILFLDEIDKKAGSDAEKSFNKSDVLKSLLKIVEGGVFEIEVARGQIIRFDTSHLTIIVGGAFTDLYKIKEENKKFIGFNSGINEKENNEEKEITIKDFEKYGMPIEFLGRFKTIIRMNDLKLDDYIKILKESDLSALKNYLNAFNEKGINLTIPDELYEKIAKLAMEFKTGARSLNIVVDKLFEEILFDYFNDTNIDTIELNSEITENVKSYKLTRKQN